MNPTAGALHDGAQYHVQEEADFVVVGAGAAGATMARWLTAAGRSVVVVEEGPPAKPATGDGVAALQAHNADGINQWGAWMNRKIV